MAEPANEGVTPRVADGLGAEITRPVHRGAEGIEQIKAQIAETRARVGATVDAIQYRLSPARAVGDATGAIRRRPVSVTVLGLGLGAVVAAALWQVQSRRRTHTHSAVSTDAIAPRVSTPSSILTGLAALGGVLAAASALLGHQSAHASSASDPLDPDRLP